MCSKLYFFGCFSVLHIFSWLLRWPVLALVGLPCTRWVSVGGKMLKNSVKSVRILWTFLAVKYVCVYVQMKCEPHTPLTEHIQVLKARVNTVLLLPVLCGSILTSSRSWEENNACNWCFVCSCILNGRVDCCLPHFIFFFLLWESLDLVWSWKFCGFPRKICFLSYLKWKDEVLLLPKLITVWSAAVHPSDEVPR